MNKEKSFLSREEAELKAKELIILLNKWNYDYYIKNESNVEDKIYDEHLKELKNLEIEYNLNYENSPTKTVGVEKIENFEQVTRTIPMLSLDSVNNFEELFKFEEKIKKKLGIEEEIEYVCEWKIDGLSASFNYENFSLTEISTRGNGLVGEKVTVNKRLIKNLNEKINFYEKLEVRGEIYMKKEEFFRLNKEASQNNEKIFSNPRNAAAGTLRNLEIKKKRELNFFAFQMILPQEEKAMNLNSQFECLKKLEELGFAVAPDYSLVKGMSEVKKLIKNREKERHNKEFESDGIVIKLNNYLHYEKLGATSRFPRWAIAFKYPGPAAETKVLNINSEVSRSGRINYIAELTPVNISGSKLSKVTLHNYSFIKKINLNISDKVILEKAGEIIPQIKKVSKKDFFEDCWIAPEECPSCKNKLKWDKNAVYQLCENENCTQKNINYLEHFASKKCLNIKGISKKIIEKLYEKKIITKVIDFFKLKSKKEELIKIEGFKKKSVENLLSSIEKAKKNVSFDKIIASLGINSLSTTKAKKIAELYETLEDFKYAIKDSQWEELRRKIGNETTNSLIIFFSKKEKYNEFEELIETLES